MIRIAREVMLAVVTCCVLANVGIAGAQDTRFAQSLHEPTWQVWPEVSHFTYREPGLMTEEGTLFGLGGSYTYRRWADANAVTTKGGYLLRLEGRLSVGQVDYDGHLLGGAPYTIQGIDDSLLELRVMGGREYRASAGLTTLFFGLGYRYLNDDSSSDPLGYQRESNYFYLPLGVQHSHDLSDEWSLTPAAEFDLLLLGLQVSHRSDVDPSFSDVTNEQPFGYGLRGSVRLEKRFDHFGLAVDPFITYWSVDESKRKSVDGVFVYEPKNWSLEYGLRFILAF